MGLFQRQRKRSIVESPSPASGGGPSSSPPSPPSRDQRRVSGGSSTSGSFRGHRANDSLDEFDSRRVVLERWSDTLSSLPPSPPLPPVLRGFAADEERGGELSQVSLLPWPTSSSVSADPSLSSSPSSQGVVAATGGPRTRPPPLVLPSTRYIRKLSTSSSTGSAAGAPATSPSPRAHSSSSISGSGTAAAPETTPTLPAPPSRWLSSSSSTPTTTTATGVVIDPRSDGCCGVSSSWTGGGSGVSINPSLSVPSSASFLTSPFGPAQHCLLQLHQQACNPCEEVDPFSPTSSHFSSSRSPSPLVPTFGFAANVNDGHHDVGAKEDPSPSFSPFLPSVSAFKPLPPPPTTLKQKIKKRPSLSWLSSASSSSIATSQPAGSGKRSSSALIANSNGGGGSAPPTLQRPGSFGRRSNGSLMSSGGASEKPPPRRSGTPTLSFARQLPLMPWQRDRTVASSSVDPSHGGRPLSMRSSFSACRSDVDADPNFDQVVDLDYDPEESEGREEGLTSEMLGPEDVEEGGVETLNSGTATAETTPSSSGAWSATVAPSLSHSSSSASASPNTTQPTTPSLHSSYGSASNSALVLPMTARFDPSPESSITSHAERSDSPSPSSNSSRPPSLFPNDDGDFTHQHPNVSPLAWLSDVCARAALDEDAADAAIAASPPPKKCITGGGIIPYQLPDLASVPSIYSLYRYSFVGSVSAGGSSGGDGGASGASSPARVQHHVGGRLSSEEEGRAVAWGEAL